MTQDHSGSPGSLRSYSPFSPSSPSDPDSSPNLSSDSEGHPLRPVREKFRIVAELLLLYKRRLLRMDLVDLRQLLTEQRGEAANARVSVIRPEETRVSDN